MKEAAQHVPFSVLTSLICIMPSVAGASNFERVFDPTDPVLDLRPIVEQQCTESRTLNVQRGELVVRFPSECRDTIEPYLAALELASAVYSDLVPPRPKPTRSTQFVVDGSSLEGNLRYASRNSDWIALANRGCSEPDWWRQADFWYGGIRFLFHELAHEDTAGRAIPQKAPSWIDEGLATFVEESVSSQLIEQLKLDIVTRREGSIYAFVGADPRFLAKVFGPRYFVQADVAHGIETFRAYELYLGAMATSELLGTPLHESIREIASIGSRKQRLRALRKLDPVELHRSSQALRTRLFEEAASRWEPGGADSSNDRALDLLGRLKQCSASVEAPDWEALACTPRTEALSRYWGSCLGYPALRDLFETLVQCPKRSWEWVSIADRLAERFPSEAGTPLREALEFATPLEAAHFESLLGTLEQPHLLSALE